MLTFQDIFKKGFLNLFNSSNELNSCQIAVLLFLALLIGCFIFFVYRVLTRRSFYSQNFGLSLVGVAVITAGIIIAIRGNIVISLGMVGALSIVRFRTAIKDPLDLMFLFWAISAGIMCGAAQCVLAIFLSLILTIITFLLQKLPMAKCPMILIVNATDASAENTVMNIAGNLHCYPKIKSRNWTANSLDLTIEVRTNDGAKLLQEISTAANIRSVSLLDHTGEATFGE